MPDNNASFNLSLPREELQKAAETLAETQSPLALDTPPAPLVPAAPATPEPSIPPTTPDQPATPGQPQEEVGFKYILKRTFSTFKLKLGAMIGLPILNIVVLFLVGTVIPLTMLIGIFLGPLIILAVLLEVIIGAILSWLFFGAIGNQAAAAVLGLPTKIGESFSSTLKNTGKAIGLTWRIFIYSRVWLVVLVLLLYPIANVLLGSGTPDYYSNAIYDSVLNSSPNLIAQADAPESPPAHAKTTSFSSFTGGLSNNNVTNSSRNIDQDPPPIISTPLGGKTSMRGLILTFINYALGLGGLAVIILAAIRSLRTVMAFPALMAHPEISSKEALEHSKEITKKRWWLVACFLAVFSFMLSGIPLILNLLASFEALAFLGWISSILSILLAVLGISLMACFLQVFSFELGNQAKKVSLHWTMIVLAILSLLLPPAISAASAAIAYQKMVSQFSSSYSSSSQNYKPISNNTTVSSSSLKTDTERIANLEKWVTAIEKYRSKKGRTPRMSDCLDSMFDAEEYYDGNAFLTSNDKTEISDTFGDAYGSYTSRGCSQVYQDLGDESYALYAALEDASKDNTPGPIKDLQAAKNFKPSSGGKYYVIIKTVNGTDTPGSQQSTVTPVLSAIELAAAKEADTKTLAAMDTIASALKAYSAEKGEYPPKSTCSMLKETLLPYLPGGQLPHSASSKSVSGNYNHTNYSCDIFYQSLDTDKYALYAVMEDTASNNINDLFQSLAEAQNFKPITGGKFLVMLKLGIAKTTSTTVTPSTIPTSSGSKVKRNGT